MDGGGARTLHSGPTASEQAANTVRSSTHASVGRTTATGGPQEWDDVEVVDVEHDGPKQGIDGVEEVRSDAHKTAERRPGASSLASPPSSSRRSQPDQVHMNTAGSTFIDNGHRTPRESSRSPIDPHSEEYSQTQTGMMRMREPSDGSAGSRSNLPEAGHRSASRLRHQSSLATIRSGHVPRRNATEATTTVADERLTTGQGAVRQERRNKSAIWEEDVARMRSESRLATSRRVDRSPDVAVTSRPATRSSARTPSTLAGDGADTSGTEGSGPVVGNRRRKKSSASAAGKKIAARAASRTNTYASSPPDDEGRRPYQSYRGERESNLQSDTGTIRKETGSGRRTALPSDFRSRSRLERTGTEASDHAVRRNSITAYNKQAWPRSDEHEVGLHSTPIDGSRAAYRPRRFASDAEAPYSDPVAAGRTSRISVDTSGVSRFLGRTSVTRQFSNDRHDDGVMVSPSEAARQRKISTSSSHSLRSSGGASELHRNASRASMRRAHGRDVFDDAPPLPEHSVHPLSPRFLTMMDPRDALHKGQSGLDRRPIGSAEKDARLAGIEDLRARLAELVKPIDRQRSLSHSSGRASRTRSNVSSTPSTSVAATSATSVRPATEPRKAVAAGQQDRTYADLSPESKRIGSTLRHAQASSRLGGYGNNAGHSMPVTPDLSAPYSRRSGSRLTGTRPSPIQHAGQPTYPSSDQRSSVPSASATQPLHARNLVESVNSFERQFLASDSAHTAVQDPHPDVVKLIGCLRDTSGSAIAINQSLRALIEVLTVYQVDAEVGTGPSHEMAAVCAEIERAMVPIVRQSNEQVRNMTDSVMAMNRCRDLFVPASPARTEHGRAQPARGYAHAVISPDADAQMTTNPMHRRASLDLRRMNANSLRQSPVTSRHPATFNTNTLDAAHASSPLERTSAKSIASRNSSDSGHRSLSDRSVRRSTSSALTNGHAHPVSPYSPSPGTGPRSNSSRIRHAVRPAGPESALVDSMQARSASQSLHHARSLSDRSYRSSDRESREKPSVPPSLSPKKPRPSMARVTTVNATQQTSSGTPSSSAAVGNVLGQRLESNFESSGTAVAGPSSRQATLTRSARRPSRQWTSSYDESMLTHSPTTLTDDARGESTTGLGLENVASRMIRSLGRHAGRRSSRELGTNTMSSHHVAASAVPQHMSGEVPDVSID